jgi:hypothetical protein
MIEVCLAVIAVISAVVLAVFVGGIGVVALHHWHDRRAT